jgi:diguanylate cyclase
MCKVMGQVNKKESAAKESDLNYALAKQHADSAMRLMDAHQIVPLPRHYAVWYAHASEGNVELTREIEKATEKSVTMDDSLTDYLYTKYIETTPEHASEAQADAKKLLADILKVIGDFSGETSSYQQEMSSHIKDLEDHSQSGDVGSMVKQIIASAAKLKDSGNQLNQKLAEAQAEAENLRENLAQATSEAQRDFLTGVFNRKALDKMMDELARYSRENNTPLCLLMIDIDHFKKFNDTYGHLIGDEVLKMVAKILTGTLKGKDIVARFGGEEFAVLLPSTPLEGALVVAELLRRSISSKELKRRDTGDMIGKITVSIGVAAFRPKEDTIPVFIKRADDALYRSKENGRNQVTREA